MKTSSGRKAALFLETMLLQAAEHPRQIAEESNSLSKPSQLRTSRQARLGEHADSDSQIVNPLKNTEVDGTLDTSKKRSQLGFRGGGPLRNMSGEHVRIGRMFSCVPNAHSAIESLTPNEMYFAVMPLAHPRSRREYNDVVKRDEPFTRSDLTLPSNVWSTNVIGALSPWINLDSSSHRVRINSEKAIKQEMMWAQHISCSAVVAPTPSRHGCRNYARTIYGQFSGYGNTIIHVHMPMAWPDVPDEDDADDPADKSLDPWETWNEVHSFLPAGANSIYLRGSLRRLPFDGLWFVRECLCSGKAQLMKLSTF